MKIDKLRVFGSSSIGVFIYTNNKIAVVSSEVNPKVVSSLQENLGVEVVFSKIYGTNLTGVFLAGNNKGILLPYHISEEEERAISEVTREKGLVVERIDARVTALGNLILANDKFAVVSPLFDKKTCKNIEDVLDVEVIVKDIGGSVLVGAIAVVTNKGLLVNPLATDEEVAELGQLFGVTADVGTVNRGSPFIKAGIVANDKGVIAGEETTGPELMRIQAIFF
ncbi:MAG: translation initiation factor IF-6 [Thermoprotei archaeon]|nr:MAG: translation initiation factor IF-6 [Thermoprotei archaeon]